MLFVKSFLQGRSFIQLVLDALRGLNMTKIESRPSKRKAWEYLFFVDCDGHFEDKKVANAIEELERISRFVKILGSYPNGD